MSTDMIDALRALYATTLSNQITGPDPVWMFLVGPSGSGKTLALMSLRTVHETYYLSQVGSKSLVSGFKQGKDERDPSIIPRLINNVAVFKDWTEVIDKPEAFLDSLYGVLRGVYDGFTQVEFGNGVFREYQGRFSILAGVTNKIHGLSKATVGERFLKFQLKGLGHRARRRLLRTIILGTGKREGQEQAIQKAALAFLDRDIPECDPEEMLPMWSVERLAALSEIIAILRHMVEWDKEGFERVLKYRPVPEIATRLCAQLAKFAMALCVVDGKRELDMESYRLVERLAFDTGIGFNLDVLSAMMMLGGRNIKTKDLSAASAIPMTPLRRRLDDLHLLKAVRGEKKKADIAGRPPSIWSVSKSLRELWRMADPTDPYLDSAKASRKG